MKRMHVSLALITTLLGMQPAIAQKKANPKPVIQIACVNIGVVFTRYEKAQLFKAEMEQVLQPYKQQAEQLKVAITRAQTKLVDPGLDAESKAKAEQIVFEGKRKLEDLDREARGKIGKKQEDHMVRLYKEVAAAVKDYAEEHNILIVLGFGEPPDDKDLFTFTNINRKLTGMDAGGATPLYVHASADISRPVTELLNERFRNARSASLKARFQGDLPAGR